MITNKQHHRAYKILKYIHDNPGQHLTAIAKGLDMTIAKTNQYLLYMESQGWLKREMLEPKKLMFITGLGEDIEISLYTLINNKTPDNVKYVVLK